MDLVIMFLFARARDETREQYGAVLLLGSPNTRYRRMCTDLYTQYLRVNLNLTPHPPPPLGWARVGVY
jgi:hypothetical protein